MRSDDQNKASFKEVNLSDAKITGQVGIDASFDGKLDASFLQAGGSLVVGSDKASLSGAKITGHVGIVDASFDGKLDASLLQAGWSWDPTRPASRRLI